MNQTRLWARRVIKKVANTLLTVQMNSGGHRARVVTGEMENRDLVKRQVRRWTAFARERSQKELPKFLLGCVKNHNSFIDKTMSSLCAR